MSTSPGLPPIDRARETATTYTPIKTTDMCTNTTPDKQIRSPSKITSPLTAYEEKLTTALIKNKLQESTDKTTVKLKTGGKSLYLMKIIKAQKTSTKVCARVLRRRSKVLSTIKHLKGVRSNDDLATQLTDELKVAKRQTKLQDIFQRAGIRGMVSMTGKQAAILRASMGASWS